MSKSEELLRLERDLNEQPELGEKLDAEIKRIAEAKEAQSDGEVMVKAAAALGYTITMGELERATADLEKLDDDELDAAGGFDIQDETGHNKWCIKSWYCFTVLQHTDTKSKDVACWSDYTCVYAYKEDLTTKVNKKIKEKIIPCPMLPGA